MVDTIVGAAAGIVDLLALTQEELALLGRYLHGYDRLVAGAIPANTLARKHFILVAQGVALPITPHEWAYLKWHMINRPSMEPPTRRLRYRSAMSSNETRLSVAKHLQSCMSSVVNSGRSLAILPSRSAGAVWAWATSWTGRAASRAADGYNLLLASDLSVHLDRWFKAQFGGAKPSIYDRAMDANYNATHVGGGDHRLFDGGHDLLGAWQAVAGTRPHDTVLQELSGYMIGLWRDVVTPNGLPLFSMERATFEQMSTQIAQTLGLNSIWLKDALTVNVGELLGSATGAVAVLLHWGEDDLKRFAPLVGSFGVYSIVAANPLLGLVALVCLARAYQRATYGDDLGALTNGMAKGGMGAAAFILSATVVSGPIWVGLVAGVCSSVIVSRLWQEGERAASEISWSQMAETIGQAFNRATAEAVRPLRELAGFQRYVHS